VEIIDSCWPNEVVIAHEAFISITRRWGKGISMSCSMALEGIYEVLHQCINLDELLSAFYNNSTRRCDIHVLQLPILPTDVHECAASTEI
jgi:hypothetical protein